MNNTERNKQLATRYMELSADGKIEEVMALVADDCVFWHPMAGEVSKEQMRQTLTQVQGMMSSFTSEIRSMTAEDDRVSVEMDIKIDTKAGKHYRNDYHFLMVMQNNKIVRVREYVDTAPVKEAFFS